MHGEFAEQRLRTAFGLDARAFERDGGVFLDIEKVWTAQVIVAFFNIRINALGLDRGGSLFDHVAIIRIHRNRAVKLTEAAVHRVDYHVIHRKADRTVRGIDLVGIERERGRADEYADCSNSDDAS